MSKGPNVLVIGTGMYVCGRGTPGYGTILPTLVEDQARGDVGRILIAGTRAEGIDLLRQKLTAIDRVLGTTADVTTFAGASVPDPHAYRRALAELPRPAAAIIAVPDHLHAAIAADVIRAGVHPLVVKPLTPTLREARALVDLCRAHGVYGAVEFHKRFDEANLLMKRVVQEGRLGTLRYCTVEFSQRRAVRELFSAWAAETNIFQYLGVHYVDLCYFVTGASPRRVLAVGQATDASREWDAIQVLIEWGTREGATFAQTIVTNWIDPGTSSAMSDQKITLVGTEGRYQSDQKHRGVQLVTATGGVEDVNPYFSQCLPDATGRMRMDGYGPRSIRQFLADVRSLIDGACAVGDLVSTRPSFQQALVSTAVIEAARASLHANGTWVHCQGRME